jgi:hypothetical protein
MRRGGVLAAVALIATFASAGPAGAVPAASVTPTAAPRPGSAGRPIILARHVDILANSVDIATTKSGTAYLGWIADRSVDNAATRTIFLCILPVHAKSCQGGIRSTPSRDKPTARDLKVLAAPSGKVTVIWWDDKTTAKVGPRDGEILQSTVQSNGSLSAAAIVADAPSNGDLLDAELAPDGSTWIVAEGSIAVDTIEVRAGFTHSPVTLHTPFGVGYGRIAFAGSQPVITIQKDGAVTTPDSYTAYRGPGSKFHAIANTWAGADPGLVSTKTGVRYLGTINDSSYTPVVSRWTGDGFTPRQPTGDHNACSPSTHDAVTDASGRVADVGVECGQLAVANLADTFHAAVVRLPAGDNAGPTPQIGTTPRGDAWVAWAVESSAPGGFTFRVEPVRLAGLQQQVSRQGGHGKVTLTGPASCLPDDSIGVSVAGSASPHWRVTSHRISLGTKTLGSTVNGASLSAGKTYALKGAVTFSDGGSHSTVTATLRFRACPAP